MGKVNQQAAVPWKKDVNGFLRKQKAFYKLARKTIDDIKKDKERLEEDILKYATSKSDTSEEKRQWEVNCAMLEELDAALEVAQEIGIDSA